MSVYKIGIIWGHGHLPTQSSAFIEIIDGRETFFLTSSRGRLCFDINVILWIKSGTLFREQRCSLGFVNISETNQ